MNIKVLWIASLFFISCKQETKIEDTSSDVKIEQIKKETSKVAVYDFEAFEKLLHLQEDKTYVVNFWATWCAPCVKELPYFEALNEKYASKNVEVLLVSLDFPKQYEKKLYPFLEKHKLKSKVVALNDPDSNAWIPKVSPDWSGAIPATVIYNKEKRAFYEQSFNYEELETEVNKFIN